MLINYYVLLQLKNPTLSKAACIKKSSEKGCDFVYFQLCTLCLCLYLKTLFLTEKLSTKEKVYNCSELSNSFRVLKIQNILKFSG